jgi:hypothetical protein
MHNLNIDKLANAFDENGTLPSFLTQLKGPQAHPTSLTELQELWDLNTSDFRKTCFQTLISYKTQKTNILKNIIDSDGEITKSFVTSVKTQEATLLISPDTPKSKHSTIKKEALACCLYWAKHRKEWIATGNQQAFEANQAIEEKAKTFKDKKESTAYSTAVSKLQHHPKQFSNPQLEQSHASSSPSFYKETSSALQSHKAPSLSNVIPCGASKHGRPLLSKYLQRSKELSKQRYNQELQRHEGHQEGQRHMNRRLPKHKNLSSRKTHTNNLLLEYKDNIMSLQLLGIIQPDVHNISSRTIEPKLTEALALGHKFIPTPRINHTIIEDSMSYFIRSTRLKWFFKDEEDNEKPEYWIPSDWCPPPESHHPYIEESLENLKLHLTLMSGQPFHNITHTQRRNLNLLLENPDLMIVTADKNLGYVITDTTWYEQACLDHLLSDSYVNVTHEYYQNGLADKTVNSIFQQLCSKVSDYTENCTITPEEAKWICQQPEEGRRFSASSFYILPKIHKTPVKGRPIVPSMTWLTFHLSEWIANQLNPLVTDFCHNVLRDSTQLIQEIININNKGFNTFDYLVLSADVEALYPNMDIQLGLSLMIKFLDDIDWADQNRRDFLLWAMEFTLTKGYIYFKGMIFQQTNGAAMGSPMIPPYANIFMHMIEKDTVMKHSNTILLYKRFIDDVFLIIKKDPVSIQTFQSDMNNLQPCIKLTWTTPSLKVDFLDITITINLKQSKIHTNTFQKPLNKYSYLPFKSYHTLGMKTGFIKGEAIRYARTCSRRSDYNRMIALFTIRLQRRGYPLPLIQQTINQVNYKLRPKYLLDKKKQNKIPYIFKILYNHKVNHKILRQQLNNFSYRIIKKIPSLPKSLKNKITICYNLPSTLHKKVLKARKDKDY